jgi:tetratricopeptide (TPR) repeat protein
MLCLDGAAKGLMSYIQGGWMLLKEHSGAIHTEEYYESYHANPTGLKPAEYFHQVKAHLRAGKQKEAFAILQQSMMHFPDEPVLLSYYGCLLVLVERKYRMGVETCLKALEKLRMKGSFDKEVYYPVFYYHLGKAYAAAGKRKEALDALKMGLFYDQSNNNIMKELRSMGIRRGKPPIPFLDRSNPLNKYIGIMLHNNKKASYAKK